MKQKKITSKRVAWIGLLVLIIYFFAWGEYNLFNLWKLHSKQEQLQSQIDEQEAQAEQLSNEIEKLRDDPDYIEKLAREQFKMGRQGEKVYIIREQDNK